MFDKGPRDAGLSFFALAKLAELAICERIRVTLCELCELCETITVG